MEVIFGSVQVQVDCFIFIMIIWDPSSFYVTFWYMTNVAVVSRKLFMIVDQSPFFLF